jgi:hypothetical protein
LERVVTLQDHLESKPKRSVANLLLVKHVDAPVDVLARDCRLELLDPHEILIVEGADPIDRDF